MVGVASECGDDGCWFGGFEVKGDEFAIFLGTVLVDVARKVLFATA